MMHAIAQAMAHFDALPDSIVLGLSVLGLFLILGLMDERQTKRRARWIPPASKPQPKPEEGTKAA